MVRVARFIVSIAGLAILAATCCAAPYAQSDQAVADPCVTLIRGQFTEFLVDDDGSVALFGGGDSPRGWKQGQWRKAALAIEGEVRDVVTEPGRRLILTQLPGGSTIIYEYASGTLREIGRPAGTLRTPALHSAQDGTLWITSGEGDAYGLRNGEVVTHVLIPELKSRQGGPLFCPSTLSLNVPGQGLWFWSHLQHEPIGCPGPSQPAIEGFHVYQDGQWQVIAPGVEKLGGAVLLDPRTIVAGRRLAGLVRVGVEDGIVRKTDIRLPPDEHTLFLHRTPSGHLLLITTRPPKGEHRPTPVFGGRLGQLLALKNGEGKELLKGVDFKRASYDKGRPVVDVPEGTFIAEAQSGLIFVSSDLETVKRVDWRHGLPLPGIVRMRAHGRQLYLLDSFHGFAIVDYPRLLESKESSSATQWKVVAAGSTPEVAPDGSIWYAPASLPAELRHCTGDQETSVALYESGLTAENLDRIVVDSKNRVWLIGSAFPTQPTAILDSGKWRTFEELSKAYSTVAQEEIGNPGYRVGDPSDFYFPAFAGDGRVAYMTGADIASYDGVNWKHTVFDVQSPGGPPFYYEGVLTMFQEGRTYQLVGGQWRRTEKTIQSPYRDTPELRRIIDFNELPRVFGGLEDVVISRFDRLGSLWAGNVDNLWRRLDGNWARFPSQRSPLLLAPYQLEDIQVDGFGGVWFTLDGGDFPRVARYRSGDPPALTWAETPPAEVGKGSLQLGVRIAGSGERYILRQQLDDAPWQQSSVASGPRSLSFDSLSDGAHRLRVQVFDELLRASKALEHRLVVKRHYDEEIREALELLKSSNLSDRERAAKILVGIGRPALPALTAVQKAATEDSRWWIQAIREEIERQPK